MKVVVHHSHKWNKEFESRLKDLFEELAPELNLSCYSFHDYSFRIHPKTVELIEKEKPKFWSVVDIPFEDLSGWYIHENEWGGEYICENHRTWRGGEVE